MSQKIEILDCTLRDGGYYTNWDFDQEIIENYCDAMESLPIDYVEVGYRSIPLPGYLGEYFYCPEYLLKQLKKLMPSKKLAIILNEKDTSLSNLNFLLKPCEGYIDLVRIAINPLRIKSAIKLAKGVKEMGFKVAFNVMYMSEWDETDNMFVHLRKLDKHVDYFYMVDSFGGVMPEKIEKIIRAIQKETSVELGFHGHDNLEMALANTRSAINGGCKIVDATITGMGRGAGNLRTELLLTYLDGIGELKVNYNKLGAVVSKYEELKKEYSWGTSLPYMFSGANSLPQKQVMEWVGMNRYPLGSIVNALNNQKDDVQDNLKLPELSKENRFKKAIILGGGNTARKNSNAIIKLIAQNELNDICLIHAGARNVSEYLEVECPQYYALVGFESEKLLNRVKNFEVKSQICVYPPFPRKMGTLIPDKIKSICRELNAITFTNSSSDSPLTVALQIALDFGVSEILLAGFDGYDTNLNEIQLKLSRENQEIFDDLLINEQISLISLTPTKYKNLNVQSLYSFVK
tara:strand:+ start:2122 stop:3678 length:1557 start_codon:yes stop_codon:yes gene_type:complete